MRVSVPFYIHTIACPLVDKKISPPAPTASDLVKYGKNHTILAGSYMDLGFLTIHGRSRCLVPDIWARSTGKGSLSCFLLPGSYLLVQAWSS